MSLSKTLGGVNQLSYKALGCLEKYVLYYDFSSKGLEFYVKFMITSM